MSQSKSVPNITLSATSEHTPFLSAMGRKRTLAASSGMGGKRTFASAKQRCMEEPTGDALFFDFVPKEARKRAGASLAELTGTGPLPKAALRSYVNETTERAWSKPMVQLTCEEVRLLAGGERGWEWLARPVAEFVHRYPAAELAFYSGDLTAQALRALPLIEKVDAAAGRLVREADWMWMRNHPIHRQLMREVDAILGGASRSTR